MNSRLRRPRHNFGGCEDLDSLVFMGRMVSEAISVTIYYILSAGLGKIRNTLIDLCASP